jgi:hypothetical protein
MFRLIGQSIQKLRPWLMAAAVVLLLTSILEAGHGHGVFVPADDTCAICQQVIGFDKVIFGKLELLLTLPIIVFVLTFCISTNPRTATPFAHIRAPPAQLHSR